VQRLAAGLSVPGPALGRHHAAGAGPPVRGRCEGHQRARERRRRSAGRAGALLGRRCRRPARLQRRAQRPGAQRRQPDARARCGQALRGARQRVSPPAWMGVLSADPLRVVGPPPLRASHLKLIRWLPHAEHLVPWGRFTKVTPGTYKQRWGEPTPTQKGMRAPASTPAGARALAMAQRRRWDR